MNVDPICLNYVLTTEEKNQFEEEGYFILKDAIPSRKIAELIKAVDIIDKTNTPNISGGPLKIRNYFDVIGKNTLFLELLNWPKTFPKVWGLLGWHIQLYHSQFIFTPSQPQAQNPEIQLGWHQDSGRLNQDIEGNPRPRISLKIAYFLTDCSTPNCGNFHVIPKSHMKNKLNLKELNGRNPKDAKPILVEAGDAVFFDRRLWHAAGFNSSKYDRKVLFFGYSYRWLRPRDNMTVGHILDSCDPIRRQLLGDGPSGGHGYTSPKPEDIPLRKWIYENLGEGAIIE